MIELFQFAWSPFCLVQRRILEYSGARFRLVTIPINDRSRVWRLTKRRYYQVPVVKDGRNVVFEVGDDSQVIAKYLDARLQLGLFPSSLEGVQSILWRFIENEVEGVGFKLNDVYWREFVRPADQLGFLRHKERRFGRGCLDQWRAQEPQLLAQLAERLLPFEAMLAHHPFLLEDRPRFVDFDLYGMLANFLYAGHHRLPAAHTRLAHWHRRMGTVQADPFPSEKLHP
jgi:glutathione S-transferase